MPDGDRARGERAHPAGRTGHGRGAAGEPRRDVPGHPNAARGRAHRRHSRERAAGRKRALAARARERGGAAAASLPRRRADPGRDRGPDRGWAVREDARRGWRRVVPSPRPLAILELEAVRTLLGADVIVVAAGGGGIPVVPRGGRPDGVDAVIDKDHASALLALGLGATRLVILTQVAAVYEDFESDQPRPLAELVPGRDDGVVERLPAGSMRPQG